MNGGGTCMNRSGCCIVRGEVMMVQEVLEATEIW